MIFGQALDNDLVQSSGGKNFFLYIYMYMCFFKKEKGPHLHVFTCLSRLRLNWVSHMELDPAQGKKKKNCCLLVLVHVHGHF